MHDNDGGHRFQNKKVRHIPDISTLYNFQILRPIFEYYDFLSNVFRRHRNLKNHPYNAHISNENHIVVDHISVWSDLVHKFDV